MLAVRPFHTSEPERFRTHQILSSTEAADKTKILFAFIQGITLATAAQEKVINFQMSLSVTDPIKEVSPMEASPVLTSYINAAMATSIIKTLDDGTYFAEIPSCPGVWVNEKTQEDCQGVLKEVFEEWLVFKLRDGDPLPSFNSLSLDIKVVDEDWSQ